MHAAIIVLVSCIRHGRLVALYLMCDSRGGLNAHGLSVSPVSVSEYGTRLYLGRQSGY